MPDRSPILSIDTSDRALGVDISIDGRSVWCSVVDEPRIHASRLVPTIVEGLRESGLVWKDVRAVAVARGPGSYTGLRIGVSTAKGLAFTLGIPLIGVATMHALATACRETGAGPAVATVLSSRKNELYIQVWDVKESIVPLTELACISFSEVPSYLKASDRNEFVVVGGGAADMKASVSSSADLSVKPVSADFGPHAVRGVALVAATRLARGAFDDVAQFEPYYLKDFVAKKGSSPFAAARKR